MPAPALPALPRQRDGTSQQARALRALDPAQVPVDERSLRDLLAFAQALAQDLRYVPADAAQADGDWRGLFDGLDLDQAAAYVLDPASVPAGQAALCARPHLALLLACLQLLGQVREQLNGFSRRHLDHFYRDLLRMSPKPAVPDQVHVLVDLESRTDRLALPAGSALLAGKDSLGLPLVYRTVRPLLANRVQVAQLRSLRAEIEVTGLRQACPPTVDDSHRPAAFVEMMKIALGQPLPGDPLPLDLKARPPVYPGLPPAAGAPAAIGFAELQAAAALIGQVERQLGMPSFDDFRALMALQGQRRDQEAADWAAINAHLVAAGRQRDPGFDIRPRSSPRFDDNVAAALGRPVSQLFSQIEEVETLEQAYAAWRSRRDEVSEALARALAPLSLDAFEAMMQTKTRVDAQWERISALLVDAGRNLHPGLDARAVQAAQGFDAKLAAALPGWRFDGGIEGFHAAFLAVERYAHMPAEQYRFLMSVATRPQGPSPDTLAWDKVYEILAGAHREMVYDRRRAALRRLAQPGIAAGDGRRALADLLAAVLGEATPIEAALLELYPPPVAVPAALAAAAAGAPDPDWDRVVQLLEVAQRNRQGLPDPVAERVVWRNLHPAADATAVAATALPAAAGAPARWKTFGRVPPVAVADAPAPPVLGWAIASPLLDLAEGLRSIELTLGFAPEPELFPLATIRALFTLPEGRTQAQDGPLQVLLSTAQGWLAAGTVAVSWAEPQMRGYPAVADPAAAQLRALVLRVTLAKGQPALVAPTRALHGSAASAPVLRLMMRARWDGSRHVTPYEDLRRLRLQRLQLKVQVNGLENLGLHNDQGRLDPRKPFEPFGVAPAVGSRLYLGHPELVGKALASLRFNIAWMGVPAARLAEHYANYPVKVDGQAVVLDNGSFKVQVALRDEGVLRWLAPASAPLPAPGADASLPPPGASLFDAADAGKPVAMALRPPADPGRPGAAVTSGDDVSRWNRCLVWELTPVDFQHAAYPSLALEKSLKLAADMANRPAGGGAALDPAAYRVNAPFTPRIKSLSADYSAVTEFALRAAPGPAPETQVFHVHPFGLAELRPQADRPGLPWLPPYEAEGELCIGLRGVAAPQQLALLFQVAEGSANPDLAPGPVQWSVLSGNQWLSLHDGQLLADATRGLINTGVVELALPAVQPSTLLPDDLYWIRAAMPRACDGVCDMVAIHPQAVLAVFQDQGNAPDHLGAPLAADSIKAPLAPIPGLARLRQPYTSFGGRMAEADAGFHLRVSERLRHRRRALTAWDYERLVLERFPQIHKVKCLGADPAGPPQDAGRIVLVVIPDIRNRLPFNPFEPKVPADQVRDIQAFLQDKVPPFVSVEVRNAVYLPVKVRCGVRFLPGSDEGFCRQRLGDELNRFLSPWAYDDGADIVIGGSLYANSIINFIDQRDYVDFLAGFKLFIGEDDRLVPDTDEAGYRASADRPDAVLVAARRHQFDLITDADYRVEEFTGIDYMMIELDFSVA